MVEAVLSPSDLDNILLKDINNDGAFGEFELEHLVLEGHAFDVLSGQSPRGLQFNLGTESNPNMYDTIVMANLVLKFFILKKMKMSFLIFVFMKGLFSTQVFARYLGSQIKRRKIKRHLRNSEVCILN
jgi:UDP-glucose:glycoprotein glucosyltransferase